MIKKVRSVVQQDRQAYRENVPTVIAGSLSSTAGIVSGQLCSVEMHSTLLLLTTAVLVLPLLV
jgi:hypothetical protein